MLGTDTGIQMNYLSAAGFAILYVGAERPLLASAFAALAVVLIIALELIVPHSTGLLSADLMLGNFIASTSGTSAILFGTVLYAMREADAAQAAAEREYERSESLGGDGWAWSRTAGSGPVPCARLVADGRPDLMCHVAQHGRHIFDPPQERAAIVTI